MTAKEGNLLPSCGSKKKEGNPFGVFFRVKGGLIIYAKDQMIDILEHNRFLRTQENLLVTVNGLV